VAITENTLTPCMVSHVHTAISTDACNEVVITGNIQDESHQVCETFDDPSWVGRLCEDHVQVEKQHHYNQPLQTLRPV
jgi:hypothetical protein